MAEIIYFDTCVWCRLFDELDHERIRREYKAVIELIDHAMKGSVIVAKSDVVFLETARIRLQRESIEKLINDIAVKEIISTEDTIKLAKDIAQKCKLNALDAFHIAVAVENRIKTFITTDDDILNKKKCIGKYKIDVRNPTEYEVI